jgi:hypothetical protein
MPRGRSFRRCRCHFFYSTNKVGPRDTHNDLAIARSGRYCLPSRGNGRFFAKGTSHRRVCFRFNTDGSPGLRLRDWRRTAASEAKREHYAMPGIPAPSSRPVVQSSSRRPIRVDLSIASHNAMFQKMQRRPRDLQLGFLTAPHSKRMRGARHRCAPHFHDASACAGVDFMIRKGSCIQSMMFPCKDARYLFLPSQLDRVQTGSGAPLSRYQAGGFSPSQINPFPGASSPNIQSPAFTTSCS